MLKAVCQLQASISVLCGEGCAGCHLDCTPPRELPMPLPILRATGEHQEKRQLWCGTGFSSFSNGNLHISCGWVISWGWSRSTEINRLFVCHSEYWMGSHGNALTIHKENKICSLNRGVLQSIPVEATRPPLQPKCDGVVEKECGNRRLILHPHRVGRPCPTPEVGPVGWSSISHYSSCPCFIHRSNE